MALTIVRSPVETILELKNPEDGLYPINHIFEPEYHQEQYVSVSERTSILEGSFQLGTTPALINPIHRGSQPTYADDEDDLSSLEYEGMILPDGSVLDSDNNHRNVCALKSNCVRFGFIDLGLARSVSRDFYEKLKNKAGVKKNDVLINSTGDGTIGRVAVYNYDFPSFVDGHIAIIHLNNPNLAWYIAAYLLSADGQNQLYRYINGSSGQVEIYPQDIERIWIKPATTDLERNIADTFRFACDKHDEFYRDLKKALNLVTK